jgi:hypothetical protein
VRLELAGREGDMKFELTYFLESTAQQASRFRVAQRSPFSVSFYRMKLAA